LLFRECFTKRSRKEMKIVFGSERNTISLMKIIFG
jgi:hypothetical protein